LVDVHLYDFQKCTFLIGGFVNMQFVDLQICSLWVCEFAVGGPVHLQLVDLPTAVGERTRFLIWRSASYVVCGSTNSDFLILPIAAAKFSQLQFADLRNCGWWECECVVG